MKDQPTPPPPPDPTKVAAAQTGSNIGTAIANAAIGNANTVGPYGSTTNKITGYTSFTDPTSGKVYQLPQYTNTTTLDPAQQGLLNQQNQLGSTANTVAQNQLNNISGTLSKPLDLSGLPNLQQDFSKDRSAVEDALNARLNPQLDRDRAALENNLTNQGFQRGSQAFTTAMDQFGRQSNDARLAVTAQGLNEQQGLYGMQSDAYSKMLNSALASRNQPINELGALMSHGQVSMPNATPYNAPQVAPTDVSGDYYNSAALANQQYGQQLQANSAQLGGIYGLGAAGILGGMKYAPQIASLFTSDRRLKSDIVDLGVRLLNGAKLYAYRYLWEGKRRVGVMADELQAIRPDAVHSVNGFLAVDYARAI